MLIEEIKDAILSSDVQFLSKHIEPFNLETRFTDEDGDTLLLYAIGDGSTEIYNFFLDKGANVYSTNDEGEGILHSIVYSGDVKRLYKILQLFPDIDINLQSKDGTTPLILSVLLEKTAMFSALLELGANVHLSDKMKYTALHAACMVGSVYFVEKLLKRNAKIDIKSANGNYPLAIAVNNDFHDIVRILYNRLCEES